MQHLEGLIRKAVQRVTQEDIALLRKKLDQAGLKDFISTKKGAGYLVK